MPASKFTDAQKAFIIKQGESGIPVADICRKAGISQATFFNWKKRYGGLMPSEMKRLKELEDENAPLKRIVADLSLDKEMLHTLSNERHKAWSQAAACQGGGPGMEHVDPEGLQQPAARHVHFPLPLSARRPALS